MEWAMRPSPMNPAAGRGATAGSHVRNGPAFGGVRTAAKLQGGGGAPVEELIREVTEKREGRGGIREDVRRRTSRDDSQHARISGVRRVEALAELQAVLVQIPPGISVGWMRRADGGQALSVLSEGRTAGKYDTGHDSQSDPQSQIRSLHKPYLHVVENYFESNQNPTRSWNPSAG